MCVCERMCVSIRSHVGGGTEIAQNILPMSISLKTGIPSPQITAAFPFVNIPTKNVKDSEGSNLLTSLKWENKGVTMTILISICRAKLSCANNEKKLSVAAAPSEY